MNFSLVFPFFGQNHEFEQSFCYTYLSHANFWNSIWSRGKSTHREASFEKHIAAIDHFIKPYQDLVHL